MMYDRHEAIYGALLQEYNVARLRKLNTERSARIAALKDRADAEKYVAEVRAKIAASFSLPERPADLKAQTVGVIDTPECRIEKIIYESRPDFPVTAHLYLPKDIASPVPAVLFLCGHAQEGKNCSTYQTGARTLAKNGFAVLLVDPISQGERYQFTNAANAQQVNGLCTREHNMLGKKLWLCDEFFGTWRAHDAICGLDYLLSRKEVDSSRVGVTGNSGGGTMTTFVQALDPRFTMAAPSCYVTSWKRNIENELPADIEQMPPGILGSGCEMGDLVLAYAPRPLLLLGQKNDFFDPRGIAETYEECRKVYKLLGAEENLQLFIGPTNHGYSVENRESMYKFFDLHAGIGKDASEVIVEVDVSTPPVSELCCAPGGQVVNLPGKKLVHDLVTEKLDEFAAGRKKADCAALKKLLTDKYGYQSTAAVPYCRVLRAEMENPNTQKMFVFSRFALETDQGIVTPLLLRDTKVDAAYNHFPAFEDLTLYVPHLGSAKELSDFTPVTPVAGVDVRGIGSAASHNCNLGWAGDFFYAYGVDYHYHACAVMFGQSAIHERLRDLLGAIAFVKSCGVKNLRLAARGQGCIIALFAALLNDDVISLKLFDAPESFDSMARADVTLWPWAVMPRGFLKYTDLPDMYDALKAENRLEIVNFCDNFFRSAL